MDTNELIKRDDVSDLSEAEFDFLLARTHEAIVTRHKAGQPPHAEEARGDLMACAMEMSNVDDDRPRWFAAIRKFWLNHHL